MSIGKRLETYYKAKNYTQKSFADSAGLNKTTINNIVLGVSNPSFQVLEAIAQNHEDLDLRWLLIGKKSNKLDTGSEVNEPMHSYLTGIKEVTIHIEKECGLTGGACAFNILPELKAENEQLRRELEAFKTK